MFVGLFCSVLLSVVLLIFSVLLVCSVMLIDVRLIVELLLFMLFVMIDVSVFLIVFSVELLSSGFCDDVLDVKFDSEFIVVISVL